MLQDIDARIEELLKACEQSDTEEQSSDSYIQVNKELANRENLRPKIEACLAEFKAEDKESNTINSTDTDSKIMKSMQGSHGSYNAQNVVDDKYGLIVHTQTTSSPTDHKQLSAQTEQAQQNTGKTCRAICADAGYSQNSTKKE